VRDVFCAEIGGGSGGQAGGVRGRPVWSAQGRRDGDAGEGRTAIPVDRVT
jgi:hypothetical protein